MPTLDDPDDPHAILARGLRLAFHWTGDRWTHSLDLGRAPDLRPLAVPVEGQADPGRVVSPAFQQLQFQPSPDDPAALQALLVGQSGPHHFSAVFTVSEAPDSVRIDVEVADRCRAEVAALASTYAVDLPSSALAEADPAAVAWDLPPEAGSRLTFASAPPARTDLREAGRRACHVQAAAPLAPEPATHRWAYSWHYRPSPDPAS